MTWPAKLSFNDMVAYPRRLDELVEAGTKAGMTGIGLHIHLVEEFGFERARDLLRASGIAVTNYAAIGHWASGVDYGGRPRTDADVIRNLDEAVELGTDIVGVNSGRLADGDKDLESARSRVVDGIRKVIPYAKERNLRLAIEPVHPIFGGSGLLIPTLRYTLDMIDMLGADPCLGVLLDTYHVWWEPDLPAQIRRAGERVFVLQVSDWSPAMVAENPRHRAMLGEGCVDFQVFLDNLPSFDGWFDNEVINNNRLPQVPLPILLEWTARSSADVLGPRLG
jgi:sugar phosphate isomerase/epimerase